MPGLPTVDEALTAVLARVRPLASTEVLPFHDALGSVVAEEIRSDGDHPPFPRSKVDGYAVRSADLAGAGTVTLRVVCRVAAGTPPGDRIGPGEAARIFTGAAVPDGADVVAMQERCDAPGDGAVDSTVSLPGDAASSENVVPRGAECRVRALVASPGDLVTPGLVGALNVVGARAGRVRARPRVFIVATGNELVPSSEVPGPGQIRNSNAPALVAAAVACGGVVVGEETVGDDEDAMRRTLARGLGADVLLVTGGVSVGDFDFVPKVLGDLGVEKVLHGVKLQPGKPLWFGVTERAAVFGLPGNPVSALVNTALFVRPALAKMTGRASPSNFPAVLGGALGRGTWRRRLVPAALRRDGGTFVATPVSYQGSGDLFGFSRAHCLVVVPEDAPARAAGDAAECVPLFEALP